MLKIRLEYKLMNLKSFATLQPNRFLACAIKISSQHNRIFELQQKFSI